MVDKLLYRMGMVESAAYKMGWDMASKLWHSKGTGTCMPGAVAEQQPEVAAGAAASPASDGTRLGCGREAHSPERSGACEPDV